MKAADRAGGLQPPQTIRGGREWQADGLGRLQLMQCASLHELTLDRVKRRQFVVPCGQRLGFGLDAEQAGEKILQLRGDIDQQGRLGFRLV